MHFRAVSGIKQFGGAENPKVENKCEQSNDNSASTYNLLTF